MEAIEIVLYSAMIFVGVCLFVWNIFMVKKHCMGKSKAEKHKKHETMLLRPFMMVAVGFLCPIAWTIMAVIGLCDKEPVLEMLGICAVFVAISVFFILWSTRQIIIYTYDYIKHRPAIGKMRTYSYADVKFMVQILADLLVHVGNRWILIDAMQDWTGLLEYYRLWQGQNGKGRKKHEPKTKFGKAMQDGQVYILVSASIFIMVIVTVMCVCFGNYSYQRGEMDVVVFFVVCWFVFAVLMLGMVYILINKDKYPKFANVLLYGKRNPDDKRKRR